MTGTRHKITPLNLINIRGHEFEAAFIIHALARLEIHGQKKHSKNVPTYSLFLKRIYISREPKLKKPFCFKLHEPTDFIISLFQMLLCFDPSATSFFAAPFAQKFCSMLQCTCTYTFF